MQRKSNLMCIVFPALLAAGLLVFSPPARAFDAGACHCFRQREYDPKARFSADDYILATSFNSLTAAYFKISKKQLVIYKMKGGIQENDLLTGLYLARTKNLELEKLLAARAREKSWKKVVSSFPALADDHRDRLIAMLRKSRSASQCGAFVADKMLADFYRLPAAKVVAARKQGLNVKEMALVFFLARTRDLPAKKLMEQVRKAGRSWSEVAFYLGFSPKAVGRGIMNFRKKRAAPPSSGKF